MLSRVPPPVAFRGFQQGSQGTGDSNAPHYRHSMCTLSSGRTDLLPANRVTVTGAHVVDSLSTCKSASELRNERNSVGQHELPILRSQYVARRVQVLTGSRWRLHRFQERTIVLHTGAEPTLAIYSSTSSLDPAACPGKIRPEVAHLLPLDTICKLVGHWRRQAVGNPAATGIQLASSAMLPALRLRIRFTTTADAIIWHSVLRETLAHARWLRDIQPLKQEQRKSIRVVHHTRSCQRFVVKVLVSDATKCQISDCHELQMLRQLHASPSACTANLVCGYRVVETAQEVLLVMPQTPGITLLQFLRQRRRKQQHLNGKEAWRLLAQLARLLEGVHQSGIVHCDLNLENVLVKSDISRVWLIDFGGAYNLLDGKNSGQEQRMTGTPGFIAPERAQYPLIPPTSKADVFSLGILLFQVLAGQHPYLDAAREQRALTLSDSTKLDWVCAEALLVALDVQLEMRELVGKMLTTDPRERISLDKVLAVTSEKDY